MAAPIAVFLSHGRSKPYTPVVDTPAGTIVDLGTWIGVATRDIAANVRGDLQVKGVVRVNKFAGEPIADGATVYFDAGTNTATGTIGYAEATMGKAWGAALAGDATVDVLLIPGMA
jgi:predicted RecA/RadA family phage recombinase